MTRGVPRTDEERLSQSAVFTLLSHTFRRGVIDCLCDYDETLTLADLADEVVCRCRDEAIEDIDAAEVKRVYMALYHTHIPKLVEYDVVEYDQERDLVAPTERAREITEYLDQMAE